MYKNITQEFMAEFCEKMTLEVNIIKSKNEILLERIASLEIKNEKYENIIYRLSSMDDKLNISEQKVTDLNKIMMKHFAYRGNKPSVQHVPLVQHQTPLIVNNPLNPPTTTLLQNPFQFNTKV